VVKKRGRGGEISFKGLRRLLFRKKNIPEHTKKGVVGGGSSTKWECEIGGVKFKLFRGLKISQLVWGRAYALKKELGLVVEEPFERACHFEVDVFSWVLLRFCCWDFNGKACSILNRKAFHGVHRYVATTGQSKGLVLIAHGKCRGQKVQGLEVCRFFLLKVLKVSKAGVFGEGGVIATLVVAGAPS